MLSKYERKAFEERSALSWEIANYTFFVISNTGSQWGYIVRVFPPGNRESFILEQNAPYETESGANYNILLFLESELYE